MVNARHLRAIEAVAKHGNFHRAAEELCITQPALSLSIKNSEDLLGVELFDRGNRSVTLTEAGDIVLRHAKSITRQFRELKRDVSAFQAGSKGELHFGIAPHVVSSSLAKMMQRIRTEYPNVRTHVQVASYDHLHLSLLAGELDFYIADVSLAREDQNCMVHLLSEHPIVFVARPGHPLSGKADISVREVIAYPFVAASSKVSSRLQHWFSSQLKTSEDFEKMERNHPCVFCDCLEVTRAIVQDSDHITGGPSVLFAQDLKQEWLVKLKVTGLDSTIETGVVSRADKPLSVSAETLVSLFKEASENPMAWPNEI